MNIVRLLKNYCWLFVILVLIAGCEGNDCIEANDFGEFDTDIVTVESRTAFCEWTDNNEYGKGSENILNCLSSETTDISTSGCKIVLSDNDKTNCTRLKECLNTSDSICASWFKFVNDTGATCNIDNSTSSDDEKKTYIQSAYSACVDKCIAKCNETNNNYEPDWEANTYKSSKGGIGIEITLAQKIEVQVAGSISLFSSSEIAEIFNNLNNKNVQTKSGGKYLNYNTGMPISIKGKWCKGSNYSIENCPVENQIGEFGNSNNSGSGNEDIVKRAEFLRKGVLILESFPLNGALDGNGNYDGPLQEPDFASWKCGLTADSFDCKSDYTNINGVDSSKVEPNNEAYPMNNGFIKYIGGYVIPKNVLNYITKNPFDGIYCITERSIETGEYIRKCSKEPDGYQVDSSNGTYTLRNGYLLNKLPDDGSVGLKISSIVYPTKIAFKIIPNSASQTKPGLGKCTLSVMSPNLNSALNVEVEADGNWHFLTDDKSNRILLNKNAYNTVKAINDSSEQDFNAKNSYTVLVKTKDGETWTDNENKLVACGEGIGVFLFPQNQILIENSGFIDFKNILASPPQRAYNCMSEDSNQNKMCINPSSNIAYYLNFEIINPMYKLISDNGGVINDTIATLLNDNFYEYKDNYNNPKIQSIGIKVQDDGGVWTNDSIFVRKGQVLSFNEDSWFDIVKVNNGYTIKNKVLRLVSTSDNTLTALEGVANGLVLKINSRPALLCLGTANEKIKNENCALDSDGFCRVSYTTFCNDTTEKTYTVNGIETKASTYCPFGCFGNTFVDDTMSGTTCSVNKDTNLEGDYSNINDTTCKNCKDYLAYQKTTIQTNFDIPLTQCYDLENYLGSVSNITKSDVTISDSEKNVEESGSLTKTDISLGAKKLKGIFEGGTYGNLSEFQIDLTKKGENSNYTEFIYNSNSNLPFQTSKSLRFLVLDNENFEFKNGYTNNKGQYELVITPIELEKNGSQLAIVLADRNWNGDLKDTKNFKSWIVKYDLDENANSGQSYGNLAYDSKYKINQNGVILNLTDNSNQIDISSLNISGVADDDYKNLRLFFKIIDKKEPKACDGSFLKTPYSKTLCKCSNESDSKFRSCDDVKSCPNNQTIKTKEDIVCVSSYYNNSGKYTVQLKTPKDILNSTGYIVKYVMEPILEVLDGKTIGLKVGTNGKFVPCQDGTIYKYGGDLPKFMIGLVCTKIGPLGQYCRKAEKAYKGCAKGLLCYLPEADLNKYGENCKNADGSWKLDENFCFPIKSNKCSIYIENSKPTDNFGAYCKTGDENCYENCSALESDLYKSQCKFVNDNGGFLQKFYTTVVNDRGYQIILRLCFTLMIMFYGMYYLLGMADLTHGELIKRVIKISFIYLMVGESGWYYYNMFFVKFFKEGVDYLVFAIAGAFDDSSSLQAAFIKNDFYDKSVLFSGVDKNLSLLFSDKVSFKIWGLFFVSFFGWLYVFLIYVSILAYITTVANALLLYLTAQFFISMLLSFGPIFFVLLIFEKTKGMFDKWLNNLIGFSFEQIFLLTCLSLFNNLIYSVIKFVLSYRVCWRPVWVLNIPILGNLELLSFWKATNASSPTAAASAVPGLFQILLIYLVADLMKNFVSFMADLGARIGGGDLTSSAMSDGIKSKASDFFDNKITRPFKEQSKKLGTMATKKLIGYKTLEETQSENKSNKTLKRGIRRANAVGNTALEKYRKDHMNELLGMTEAQRNSRLADVRDTAVTKFIDNNDSLQKEMKNKGINTKDLKGMNASKFSSSITGEQDLMSSAYDLTFGSNRKGVASDKRTQELKNDKVKFGSGIKTGKYTDGEILSNDLKNSKNKEKGGDFTQERSELKTDVGQNNLQVNNENNIQPIVAEGTAGGQKGGQNTRTVNNIVSSSEDSRKTTGRDKVQYSPENQSSSKDQATDKPDSISGFSKQPQTGVAKPQRDIPKTKEENQVNKKANERFENTMKKADIKDNGTKEVSEAKAFKEDFNKKVEARSGQIKEEASTRLKKDFANISPIGKMFNKSYKELNDKVKNPEKIAEKEVRNEEISKMANQILKGEGEAGQAGQAGQISSRLESKTSNNNPSGDYSGSTADLNDSRIASQNVPQERNPDTTETPTAIDEVNLGKQPVGNTDIRMPEDMREAIQEANHNNIEVQGANGNTLSTEGRILGNSRNPRQSLDTNVSTQSASKNARNMSEGRPTATQHNGQTSSDTIKGQEKQQPQEPQVNRQQPLQVDRVDQPPKEGKPSVEPAIAPQSKKGINSEQQASRDRENPTPQKQKSIPSTDEERVAQFKQPELKPKNEHEIQPKAELRGENKADTKKPAQEVKIDSKIESGSTSEGQQSEDKKGTDDKK